MNAAQYEYEKNTSIDEGYIKMIKINSEYIYNIAKFKVLINK